MANANTLEIILQATDNATNEIKKVKGELDSIDSSTRQLQTTTNSTTNSIKNQFKEASASLKDFRRTMFAVTAAMTAVVASVREAAKFSDEAKITYTAFTATMQELAVTLGTVLSPALQVVVGLLDLMNDLLSRASSGWAGIITFFTSMGDNVKSEGLLGGMKQSLDDAAVAQNNFMGNLDTLKNKVQDSAFKKLSDDAIDLGKIIVKTTDQSKAAIATISSSITQSLGNAFVGIQNFAEAWQSIWQQMALSLIKEALEPIIAKLLVIIGLKKAIGWIGGFFGLFHEGGEVMHSGGIVRAHSGLAVDEVPIIAQRGEGILSRRGMSALGGAGMLNALNGGYSMGSTININMGGVTVRNDQDIQALTEEISRRLARETERL